MNYRFREGITFQELKARGNLQDMAEAAYAIGAALAHIRTVPAPPNISARPPAWRELLHDGSHSLVLKLRIGAAGLDRWREIVSAWLPQLRHLDEYRTLARVDFNNRNTLVKQENGKWTVSGILDWELAFAGSGLWDAARFVCYESRERPRREPHFSLGYRHGGGELPDNWSDFSCVINIVSAAESLSRPDLPERFVPELSEWVISALARNSSHD